MMYDTMSQLRQEHISRQLQRVKARAPLTIVSIVIVLIGVWGGVFGAKGGYAEFENNITERVSIIVAHVVVAFLWWMAAQLLQEWDRAVVLRFGHFRAVKGPGFFMVIPFIDSIVRIADMRVRTTPFYGEAMLTKDTVPVDLDAIAFWHVWDAKKAVLEVENYYQAIVLAVQTALRDIVGVHTLAEILSEREMIAQTLQKVLEAKTEGWGITVNSIEIRDITIPEKLKDALSKQAQAERERQSRVILGQAEMEIAQKFAEAAKGYLDNPIALQLRAMNIVYEGIRAGSSLMLVPSTVLDTMNLGGLAALGTSHMQKTQAENSKEEKASA
jgi:regulator of protease activity HflC (stomatin/prohibitin superfamily)